MWSTYLLIFLMLCIGVAGWLLFIWAVKSGQYDDVEGPKYRMLDDDEQGGASDEPPARDTPPPARPGGHQESTDGPPACP